MQRRRKRRGFTLMEVAFAAFLMAMGVLAFAALYPTAAKASRMSGYYQQAISEVQHKVDQLRAVGYGRITYTELVNAGIIDAAPGTSPYRFEGVDNVSAILPSPVGTIRVAPAGTDLLEVTVQLSWGSSAIRSMKGDHSVTVLIANE